MTVTILIDLDDTLLCNNMDTFLPTYLQGLSGHLSTQIDPQLLVKSLLKATGKMTQKIFPATTLEQTFDDHFYPAIGILRSTIDDQIQQFYTRKFPLLRSLTSQKPGAIQLVHEFFRRGWEVIVATNPLFPRTAILQRLEWAGLSADQYPFLLVPSFEMMHFAKPHPAYFAELLGQVGWPDRLAVMIGNSLSDDILPANQLGLPAFWLTDQLNGTQLPQNSQAGSIEQVIPWIESCLKQDHSPFEKTPTASLAVLQATPAALESRSRNFTDLNWHHSPESGEWSPVEILCHLRDVDREVNLPRIKRVLAEDSPLLTGLDTDNWAESRAYAAQSGPQAAMEFMHTRTRILETLMTLSPESWQRPCRHTIFGKTTLAELVNFMATHDRSHLQQFCRAVECKNN